MEVLPVSRQAIAKHLAVLQDVGLVTPVRVGREVQYRVLGSQLTETARRLDVIGVQWDRGLATIKQIAEGLESQSCRRGGGAHRSDRDCDHQTHR